MIFMKSLNQYIEEMDGMATPGNTVGMGNPMLPTAEEPGTEPLCTAAKCKKEKKKKVKESLLDDENDLINKDPDDIEILKFASWIKEHLDKKRLPNVSIEWIKEHLSINEKKYGGGFNWNEQMDRDADLYLILKNNEKMPFKLDTVAVANCMRVEFPNAKTVDLENFPNYIDKMNSYAGAPLYITAPKAADIINKNKSLFLCHGIILDMPLLKKLSWDGDMYGIFDVYKCKSLEEIGQLPQFSGRRSKIIIPQEYAINVIKQYSYELSNKPFSIK